MSISRGGDSMNFSELSETSDPFSALLLYAFSVLFCICGSYLKMQNTAQHSRVFEETNFHRNRPCCRQELWPRFILVGWLGAVHCKRGFRLYFYAGNRGYYMAARGYVQHEKIKFVSPSGHVMFC